VGGDAGRAPSGIVWEALVTSCSKASSELSELQRSWVQLQQVWLWPSLEKLGMGSAFFCTATSQVLGFILRLQFPVGEGKI